MSAEPGVQVEGLTISLRGGQLPLVTDVSIGIGPGEALGLVGESGSGKTLTARAILGFLPSQAEVGGRITLGGTSLLDLPPRERERLRGGSIGMVFQDPMSSLNPVLRIGDAIAQVIRSHERVDGATARRRAVEMLGKVGIARPGQRTRAFPHQFSGGMRQRIMIALALAARPAFLLADEPTTALDVIVQDGILRLLDGLRRTEGMGLLFVSHDLAVVARMCERIAVMYAGRVVEEGPAAEILHRPRMPYTQGLLASIPDGQGGGHRRLQAIGGSPPRPGQLPDGCSFAPRCPWVVDACRRSDIPMVAVGARHGARCIRTAELGPVPPVVAPPEVAVHG